MKARCFLMKHLPCCRRRPDAKLVDVRSRAEWDWVGRIPGAVEIEWQSYPGMRPNPDFTNYLSSQVDKESLVMFICRSGGRSHQAAATATEWVTRIAITFSKDLRARRMRAATVGPRVAGRRLASPGYRVEQ